MVIEDVPKDWAAAIAASGKSIYDPIEVGDPDLWVPSDELEKLLESALKGLNVDFPIKTRSKIVKEAVCTALGYPVPKSFTRCKPRFKGQNFDVYTQLANNLQVWNDGLTPSRRYVLVRPNAHCIVERVKVLTGAELAPLDTTGTLTKKYQARVSLGSAACELVAKVDTATLSPLVSAAVPAELLALPNAAPDSASLMSIQEIFTRLCPLVGSKFPDPGNDQERNRGAGLHQLVCDALGYSAYADDGQFPDITHQLLEVKLQTAATIDLGLVLPNSEEPLDISKMGGHQIRACDTRYAIFYGSTDGTTVTVSHLFLTTGEEFFTRFTQFGGMVVNSKKQLHLPADFFDPEAKPN